MRTVIGHGGRWATRSSGRNAGTIGSVMARDRFKIGMGNRFPKGLRFQCKAGNHASCRASKCSCECHVAGLKVGA
jgi:hypothetical protein